LTLLNSVKHFWGFGGREGALEQCVVVDQQHHIRLAVRSLELLKDQENTHQRVHPCHVLVVGNFELVGNVLVEHGETCSVDVGKQEVVIIIVFEAPVRHFDCRFGGKIAVHRKNAGIRDKDKMDSWLN
jgi:hypothetical protein